jgi:hypothetical protein
MLASCASLTQVENEIAPEEVNAAVDACDMDLDISKLTDQQGKEYRHAMIALMTAYQGVQGVASYYRIENEALLDGATNEEDLHTRMATKMNLKLPETKY